MGLLYRFLSSRYGSRQDFNSRLKQAKFAVGNQLLNKTFNPNKKRHKLMDVNQLYYWWDTKRSFGNFPSNRNGRSQTRLQRQKFLHEKSLVNQILSTETHATQKKKVPFSSRLFTCTTTLENSHIGHEHDDEMMAPGLHDPMDQRILFQYFQLNTFSESEIDLVFDSIAASATITHPSYTLCQKNTVNASQLSRVSHNQQNSTSQTTAAEYIYQQDIAAFLFKRIQQIDADNSGDKDIFKSKANSKEYAEVGYERRLAMQEYANAQSLQAVSLLQTTYTNTVDQPKKSSEQEHELSHSSSSSFSVSKSSFRNQIQALATNNLNFANNGKRNIILPLSLSMFFVGSSVGVVIPIMPFIVSDLGLTATQYGIVISSFAAAKLLANVPAAVYAERYGRKPSLVRGLLMLSVGVGGIGLASQFEHLVICRLLVGIGVSSLSTASTLAVTDHSTALNRARSMAPVMSAFAAGMAMGPAVGGVLGDAVGVPLTFCYVGCSYLVLAGLNGMFLEETKLIGLEKRIFPWQKGVKNRSQQKTRYSDLVKLDEKRTKSTVLDAMIDAISQWSPLLTNNPRVRNVITLNGFYWVALSGSQMTLLPLVLTDPSGLALSATSVGKVYMGMSLVQVLGNPTLAKFIDVVGRVPGILMGCSMLSTSMFLLPYVITVGDGSGALGSHHMTLAATLGCWVLGSTMLSTAPVSYVTDAVSEDQRAQAIALLRTAGDIGFLVGASGTGIVADWSGMDIALQSNAGLLLSATGWLAARRLLEHKEKTL